VTDDSQATYRLFHKVPAPAPDPGDDATLADWAELGTYRAMSHHAALAEALTRAPNGDGPVTVAAVSARFWNEGTATVELKPVTTWERPT
jgi:hypothetical protein